MMQLDATVILVAMVQIILAKLLTTLLNKIHGQPNKTESLSWNIDISNLLLVQQRFFMKSFQSFNALISFLSK